MASPETATWTNGEHGGVAMARGADARRALREAGLRVTEQRLRVYEALQKAARPMSHPEMVALLPQDGMDRTTVYRILMDLTERGLAHRRDLGDHVWRFERKHTKSGHPEGHPHFVCVDCGGVSCLPEVAVKIIASSGAPKALGTKQVEVQVKGRCDDCT